MYEKTILEREIEERDALLHRDAEANNRYYPNYDNYTPLYDNSGWCSRFN